MMEFLKSLSFAEIIGYLLPVAAIVFSSFVIKTKAKLKDLIELLKAFSDAIEDKKEDANERQDLVVKAKKLLGKLGYLLPIAAIVFSSFGIKTKAKLKDLIELLKAFSDAIEDNKVDANERQDLVVKAKKLLGK